MIVRIVTTEQGMKRLIDWTPTCISCRARALHDGQAWSCMHASSDLHESNMIALCLDAVLWLLRILPTGFRRRITGAGSPLSMT